jgi:hypothetical protein
MSEPDARLGQESARPAPTTQDDFGPGESGISLGVDRCGDHAVAQRAPFRLIHQARP